MPNRDQFKHVLFAPDLENGLEASVFPFAREAIATKDWKKAAEAIKMTADVLNRAGERLGQ